MIENHDRAVLQFSGGKDSLACLHLLKPYWERITVLWVNPGAAYPETIEQMNEVRAVVLHFVEVTGNQPAFIEQYGYPSDLIPVASTVFGAQSRETKHLVQSWGRCCEANLWIPMHEATMALDPTLIIRGQRADDYRKAPIKSGHTENGITYWFPLEDWTEADVLSFLKDKGIPLPKSYEWADTSLDCWNCTAFLEEREKELRNLPTEHPELWPEVRRRLEVINEAVEAERKHLQRALWRSS